jgi:hypothetical protein
VQDLILRTQSEVIAIKQRAVKLARMWEERKHSTTSPRADRALVLMEVARDAALAAGVIQEIKMALDAKEFIDLLVKFRFVETVDDEGAARDFLARQPKEKVEELAARFFNVFKADLGRYGAVHLDRGGRPLLVEGPRLVAFVKWFVEQLLLEKEADEGVKYFKGLEDGTIAPPEWKPRPDVPASLIEKIKGVDITRGELQPNGDLIVTPSEEKPFPDSALADPEVTPGEVIRNLPDKAYDAKGRYVNRLGESHDEGVYIGEEETLKGERAIVRIGARGLLAQFNNRDLPEAAGWHAFAITDFKLDSDVEDKAS